MAVVLLALAACAFAAAAVALWIVGLMAVAGDLEGGVGAGIATIVIGGLLAYVTYLLARAAWRIQRVLGDKSGRRTQWKALRRGGIFALVTAAEPLGLPLPRAVIVGTAISTVLIGVVMVAAALEPNKVKRSDS